VLTTRLSTTTSGATITFVNGSSSEDLRPRYTVYGDFQRISERSDYTVAYDNDDAALTATMSAKIDDRRHTANVYNDSVLHGAIVRRGSAKRYFGADNRVFRSEETVVEDVPSVTRVDTVFRTYTGLGLARSVRDAVNDTMRTNYDGVGRAIETINHDGTSQAQHFTYGTETTFGVNDQDFFGFCLATTSTNENGVKFTTYIDAFDRVRREVADSNGLHTTTRFEYDLAGRLTRAINPKGDTTLYWYDEFGSVQYKCQPDIGIISYAYDKLGRIRFQQDNMQGAQRRLTYNQYDDLGRLTLTGEAYFATGETGYHCGGDYNEDDNYGTWNCDDPLSRPGREDTPPEKTRRIGRSTLGVLGDDPASDRLTNQLNPDTLHTWPIASLPTANPTVWATPAGTVPSFSSALKFVTTCGQLQANTLLRPLAHSSCTRQHSTAPWSRGRNSRTSRTSEGIRSSSGLRSPTTQFHHRRARSGGTSRHKRNGISSRRRALSVISEGARPPSPIANERVNHSTTPL
jgi:YD repeat-containing protein